MQGSIGNARLSRTARTMPFLFLQPSTSISIEHVCEKWVCFDAQTAFPDHVLCHFCSCRRYEYTTISTGSLEDCPPLWHVLSQFDLCDRAQFFRRQWKYHDSKWGISSVQRAELPQTDPFFKLHLLTNARVKYVRHFRRTSREIEAPL
jgi:hypothetical protein